MTKIEAQKESSMKERPIIFSSPMVRAILDGKKTQTRRVVKPVGTDGGFVVLFEHGSGWWPYRSDDGDSSFHTVRRGGKLYLDETPHACPYGQPGDLLWVREAVTARDGFMVYAADGGRIACGDLDWPACIEKRKTVPSIHMPRWASRIALEVTDTRVERLQDISEADAIAEGAAGGHGAIPVYGYSATPVEHYRWLWDQINGSGSWDANPWVWMIEFRRVAA